MERPVVISSGGSAKEIVGKEEFGLLVRPDDAFDLQHKLRFLLDHPEVRERMGKEGRAFVRARYDRLVRLKKTLELYDRILKRRGIG